MAAAAPPLKKRPDAINLTPRHQVKTSTPASSEKPNRIFGVKSNRQRHSRIVGRALHRLIFGASPDCGPPDAKRRRGQANSARNRPTTCERAESSAERDKATVLRALAAALRSL